VVPQKSPVRASALTPTSRAAQTIPLTGGGCENVKPVAVKVPATSVKIIE
jgi:hypothetical protein